MIRTRRAQTVRVSVLFSEPKISQFQIGYGALEMTDEFQCSSASRKFLNSKPTRIVESDKRSFSALQRAENFSISSRRARLVDRMRVSVLFSEPKISQFRDAALYSQRAVGFSALQRAENFSIQLLVAQLTIVAIVSVLFSEPKISQSTEIPSISLMHSPFQCSSASRKFLNTAPT